MIKKLFLSSFALMVCYSLSAQISFGPRIGISQSKIQVDERFTNNGEEITYNTEGAKMGFHVGAFARIKVASFYVQPELLFTSAGGKIAVESDSRAKEIQEITYNKIDVPVMAGLKLLKFIRVQAGPVFSLNLNSDARNTDVYDDVENNYKKASVGYQAGVGIDISDLYIDFKYEGNLSKFGESVSFGSQEFDTDMRNTMLMIVVGYNLF